MTEKAPVFDRIISDYLKQVATLDDRIRIGDDLGVAILPDGFRVPVFNRSITITDRKIVDDEGNPPSHSASVLVCRYLLLCPDRPPVDRSLVTYKDFRDAAPYVQGFRNTAERPIATGFSGRLGRLEAACLAMGGRPFDTDVACQLAFRFQALPRVPMVLIFHDADEDFPSQCTLLFQKDAAVYLDMECLAMVAGILTRRALEGDDRA